MILPSSSGEPQNRFAEALALHEKGQLEEAERRYRVLLADQGGHVPALIHLAALRLQRGDPQSAVGLAREALQYDPDCVEAHSHLGTALHMQGRHEEAIACYEDALVRDPERCESHYGLGLTLHALARHDEAAACYERALAIDPDYAEASCALGAVLVTLKESERAIACYRRALAIDPDYVEAICGLAGALQEPQKDPDAAIALYGRAIALQPGDHQILHALGEALLAAGRYDEAIAHFRGILAVMPDHARAQLSLGTALGEIGRIAEAQTALEKALTLDPQNLRYAFALVNARPVGVDDPGLRALQAAAARHGGLAEDERILFHFAFAKALADLGRHEESFRHLVTANALQRRTFYYDEAGTLGVLERIRTIFTPDLLVRLCGAGHPSALPIFIVGMPRSGSTLVEHILASHRDVFGGGERADLTAALNSVGINAAAADFPECCTDIDRARVKGFAADYLDRLSRAAAAAGQAGVLRITDKMLANYCFAGLIHLALPNARILHIRRDPIDTALSCFSKLFAADIPYAYDLGEIGRYCRACDALMEHWRALLPPGTILEVQYEELVGDFEPQVRRILAHCGLDWDPACLSFHQTERPVRTASVMQVRQPLYRNSVGRWHPGKDVLQPLLEALGCERQ